jgi:hypothetical protein
VETDKERVRLEVNRADELVVLELGPCEGGVMRYSMLCCVVCICVNICAARGGVACVVVMCSPQRRPCICDSELLLPGHSSRRERGRPGSPYGPLDLNNCGCK